MPIYEYRCPACGHRFSHFYGSIRQAEGSPPPVCPNCGNPDVQRLISRVAVLGERGPDPAEVAAENAQAERMASITPKETIDKLRAGKPTK